MTSRARTRTLTTRRKRYEIVTRIRKRDSEEAIREYSVWNYREAPVKQHLKNVYGCLSLSTVAAAIGAYVHLYTEIQKAGFLTAIGGLGLLIALMSTPDNGKNQKLRLGYLLGFAFLSGLGLGPLLDIVISIDPSIIVTGLIGYYHYYYYYYYFKNLQGRGVLTRRAV